MGYIIGSTATRDADTSTANTDASIGLKILVNKNINGLRIRISNNHVPGATEVCLLKDDAGTTISSHDIKDLSAGDTFDIIYEFQALTTYRIEANNDAFRTVGRRTTGNSFPYTSTDVNITNGSFNGADINTPSSFDTVSSLILTLTGPFPTFRRAS